MAMNLQYPSLPEELEKLITVVAEWAGVTPEQMLCSCILEGAQQIAVFHEQWMLVLLVRNIMGRLHERGMTGASTYVDVPSGTTVSDVKL